MSQGATRKKTILVTGGLGHVGSRLIRELARVANEVVIVDNLATQRYASLFHLPNGVRYRFVEADVRTADFAALLPGIDAVIHLAALTDAEASVKNAAAYEAVNVAGLARVAEACRQQEVRLLFPSTTSVHGPADNPYVASKRAGESLLEALGRDGLQYVILRWGTIFGPSPGMRFHTAVNRFVWQALTGQPLTVWQSAWQQQRPYLELGDCIAAVLLVLERGIFGGGAYDVVTGQYTVEDVVREIHRWRPQARYSLVASPVMNTASFAVDEGPLRSLGFRPKGTLRRGVADTFAQLNSLTASEPDQMMKNMSETTPR